jgi:exopolyphosphatase / guanosine-5'-triphosphate,3'-diphosphate pyrophosphatase
MLLAASPIKKFTSKKLNPQGERIAVIDLGTNSVRFDVYQRTEVRVVRIHREKRMIRLGEKVFETGRLTKAAMRRGLDAFEDFKAIMEGLGVTRVRAFGTSALRSAKNAKQFVRMVKEKTGISIITISGQREGQLISRGIFAHLNPPARKLALVDIGGGSTEISICVGKTVIRHVSLKLGASRIQQMFLEKGCF